MEKLKRAVGRLETDIYFRQMRWMTFIGLLTRLLLTMRNQSLRSPLIRTCGESSIITKKLLRRGFVDYESPFRRQGTDFIRTSMRIQAHAFFNTDWGCRNIIQRCHVNTKKSNRLILMRRKKRKELFSDQSS